MSYLEDKAMLEVNVIPFQREYFTLSHASIEGGYYDLSDNTLTLADEHCTFLLGKIPQRLLFSSSSFTCLTRFKVSSEHISH